MTSSPTWIKELKALIAQIPTGDDFDHIVHEMYHGHDRGAALVASTQIEEVLGKFLKCFMVAPLSTTLEEQLFERDAPLSSFSKQIRIAYAFKMIDQPIRQHLDIIREIRNAFAHSRVHITFETPAVRTACLLLPRYFEKFDDGTSPDAPKARYVGAATRLMKTFGNAISVKAASLPLSYPD